MAKSVGVRPLIEVSPAVGVGDARPAFVQGKAPIQGAASIQGAAGHVCDLGGVMPVASNTASGRAGGGASATVADGANLANHANLANLANTGVASVPVAVRVVGPSISPQIGGQLESVWLPARTMHPHGAHVW